MPIILVPRLLREKLGDEASDSLVGMLNEYGKENRQSVIEQTAQKFETHVARELSHFRVELNGTISELKSSMSSMDSAIRADLGREMSSLKTEMHQGHANLIKWNFVFWIGQVAAMVAILFAFLKT